MLNGRLLNDIISWAYWGKARGVGGGDASPAGPSYPEPIGNSNPLARSSQGLPLKKYSWQELEEAYLDTKTGLNYVKQAHRKFKPCARSITLFHQQPQPHLQIHPSVSEIGRLSSTFSAWVTMVWALASVVCLALSFYALRRPNVT